MKSIRVTPRLTPMAAALACALLTPSAMAASTVYTTTANFAAGTLQGVSATAVPDQLQLSSTGSTYPLLWIANAGEDTLSKIDTQNNVEVARYRTWFGPSGQSGYYNHLNNPWAGAAPSRSAVDVNGNAFILNREFRSGKPAVLLKVLASGGVDRNGNLTIDTSACPGTPGQPTCNTSDPLQLKPLADSNNNGRIDLAELQDERVAWATEVGPNNGVGRALCMAPDGNLWVGLYTAQQFWKVDANTGAILKGPISVSGATGFTPYGCVVDSNGTIWSATLNNYLGRIDNPDSASPVVRSYAGPSSNYGIAIGNGMIYLADQGSQSFQRFNPTTATFDRPANTDFYSLGISVDGNNQIVVGWYGTSGVAKFNAAGTLVAVTASRPGIGDTRGAIPDSDNNTWHVNLDNNSVDKFVDDGTGNLVRTVRLPVGNKPYTYSDASGIAALTQTTRTGSWDLVKDSGNNGTVWNQIAWNASVPTDTSLVIKARAYNDPNNLQNVPWSTPSNGGSLSLTGRYIEVLASFTGSAAGDTPVLTDLTVFNQDMIVNKCDVNTDNSINRTDIGLITAANGQTASGPNDARDANNDGRINILDARACTLRCTKPACAL